MNWFGVFLIFIGLCYLIYSIIFRSKVTLYFKDIKVIEGKEEEYLKLQLYFSFINSLMVVSIGIIITMYNLDTPYIVLTPLIVHLVNFAMKLTSKQKGYVEY
ncbi:hypothetical protein Amet_2248 [Alkaliphilus metalliredigens QYMF]|uniref:DUF3784 domain-containing protein n=1 Tax=Alkaliphilus metalliredigens (strain QYMF) TaxID=293826 RepID=A6TQD8_ALKMQ|nr:hypothetical protein [Alkaliphilus metalliredigens]ABR48406.1 hypothetical protein Amet_2248 [Alkaliphilus metalliredigens QYMF]